MEDEPEREGALTSLPAALASLPAKLPEKWFDRFVQAGIQLLAGTKRGAELLSRGSEEMDTIRGRSKVSDILAEAAGARLVVDPEEVTRAIERFGRTAVQQQRNLEAVIEGAVEYLPPSPPPPLLEAPQIKAPESFEGDGGGPKNSSTPNEDRAQEPPLGSDWSAAFASAAEGATSDQLRDRLSRVLAGELASPGLFKRSVIRGIVEAEQEDLQRLLQYTGNVVLGDLLFAEGTAHDGERLRDLIALEDAGFVTSSQGGLSYNCQPIPDGQGNSKTFLITETFGIEVRGRNSQPMSFPMVPLTRLGQAALQLLGNVDDRANVLALGESIHPAIGNKAYFLEVTAKLGDGRVQYNRARLLRQGPPMPPPPPMPPHMMP